MEVESIISDEQASQVAREFGTPAYVYSESKLRRNAKAALGFPNAFGLTVRYAVKAAPNAAILKLFHGMGLHFDASSGFEARRILAAGVPAAHISLSTQELPEDFAELVDAGIKVNLCSLSQVERFGEKFPGGRAGIRFNPGKGSGANNRTNVGGIGSSFGIWHEHLDKAKSLADRHDLVIERIHTHIGSGSDPAVWQRVAELSLSVVRAFPDVTVLNMGGGYKVGRMPGEKSTDFQVVGAPVREQFEALANETGRRVHLEIEPGTSLVANAAVIVSRVQDKVDTGAEGYRFLKLDTGMTDILRPSLYGSQHFISLVPRRDSAEEGFVIVGHCCESGDILTPAPGEPEVLATRALAAPERGDLCIIHGAGAYCSAMPAKHYNSFPESPEVLLREDGRLSLIRRRQQPEQVWQNELPVDDL